jgi:hypothetical protein
VDVVSSRIADASLRVACHCVSYSGACCATVGLRGNNGPAAKLLTATALGGAATEVAPCRNVAINGATMHVAVGGQGSGGTGNATVSRVVDDAATMTGKATAAGLAAGGPSGPARDLAVDRAGMSVACARFGERGT